MKKIYSLILLFALSIVLVGCKSEKYTLYCPSGIPLMAIGGVADEFDTTVTNGPMELSAELMKGDIDAIVAPLVLGANLYNKGQNQYYLASVITTANVYIVSKKGVTLNSIHDLEGKTIYSYGEGGVPDTVLKYIVNSLDINCTILNNGLDSAENLVNTVFLNNTADYILCAEPIISNLKHKLNMDLNVLNLENDAKELGLDFIGQAGLYLNKNNEDNKNEKIIKKIKNNISNVSDYAEYAELLLSKDQNEYPLFSKFDKDTLVDILKNGGIIFDLCSEHKDTINTYYSVLGININIDGFIYE